jgi:flavin reductase (DIM6/NTAB) family NADH-FMN oxidoreductase RutF
MSANPIDPMDLRRAFGVFATGVTVTTTIDQTGAPRGFTANSFTSVSLDPPLVLVCLAKTASSCPAFSAAPHFVVNILAEDQRHVSAAFASRSGAKFDAVAWAPRTTGAPVLDGVAAWIDCVTHDVVDGGDHVILIGRVVDYAHGPQRPLGYCRGAYVTFGLAEQAIEAAGEHGAMRVGAIVEHAGAILFQRDPATGALRLPIARHVGTAADPNSLKGRLAAAGVAAELAFLFAVFEDPATGTQFIFYRGEAGQPSAAAQANFIPFGEIAWERIGDEAVRSMLRRYVREREQDDFGIYVGDVTSGTVQALAAKSGRQGSGAAQGDVR